MTERNPKLIVGNWKMNGTIEDTLKLITEIRHKISSADEIVVAPPFTALYSASVILQETAVKLAAQNMFWENEGAYTGEVSGVFLKDLECKYVILGHSERRHVFGETDAQINKKLLAAISLELIPIFCIGETLEQREKGQTEAVIESQIKKGLSHIAMSDVETMVIAYEPVWAIGTGKHALPDDIEKGIYAVRHQVSRLYDAPTADKVHYLYGGSVSPENAKEIFGVKGVDGVLVGGASLVADKFIKIIQAAGGELKL